MHRKWLFFEKLSNRFNLGIRVLELLIAFILVLFAVVSAVNLVISAIPELSRIDILFDYAHFQELLSFLLLLIISLEMAIMLVKQNPNNVLEVMIYAIARKLLVSSTTAFEILIGVFAIVILFFLRIYMDKRNKPLKSSLLQPDPPPVNEQDKPTHTEN